MSGFQKTHEAGFSGSAYRDASARVYRLQAAAFRGTAIPHILKRLLIRFVCVVPMAIGCLLFMRMSSPTPIAPEVLWNTGKLVVPVLLLALIAGSVISYGAEKKVWASYVLELGPAFIQRSAAGFPTTCINSLLNY
jgi:hypothetical protein